ncbi:hypothetical protein O4H52_03215 [Sphingomonadaceae bacterium G21617-S1]|nr:hypothetical protein [Sphingomonadaceae bacterium G21617-S1]
MYVSPKDPLNSVHDWFQARTYQAVRPQHWTPEANLYADYLRHAEAAGVAKSRRVGPVNFATEMRGLMRREPQRRLATRVVGTAGQMVPFWPRVLRNARLLAA